MSSTPLVGTVVTHRRYVPYSHAHYAGNLVDGAYSLAAFGDVATELLIRLDGDEGLFRRRDRTHLVALLPQQDGQELAHRELVVDDDDRLTGHGGGPL